MRKPAIGFAPCAIRAKTNGTVNGGGSMRNEADARKRAKRRAEGKCLACGKPSAPRVTCQACGKRANLHRKAKREAKK